MMLDFATHALTSIHSMIKQMGPSEGSSPARPARRGQACAPRSTAPLNTWTSSAVTTTVILTSFATAAGHAQGQRVELWAALCRLVVDVLVAGAADDQGLVAADGHPRDPCGLVAVWWTAPGLLEATGSGKDEPRGSNEQVPG
jgi:hypothetical protein